MVISSHCFKATNGLRNAPEAISESLKFKNFLREHVPRPPYREHCHAQSLRPPKFSLSIILAPLVHFSKWNTAMGDKYAYNAWLCCLWNCR